MLRAAADFLYFIFIVLQVCFWCAPEGIRTPNLLIRSQMLYPLSYGRLMRVNPTCFLYAPQTFRKPFIALFYARISYPKDSIAFALTSVNSGSYFFN